MNKGIFYWLVEVTAKLNWWKPIWETYRGKAGFLNSLAENSKLLDVGCGNESASWIKWKRPDIYYVGIDIADYNQTFDSRISSDEYIIVAPDKFAERIESMSNTFDAVISSHNIEHCLETERVIISMLNALKPGGLIYLSTPCSASLHFPKRSGTLNFFDDGTHVLPVKFDFILSVLKRNSCEVLYKCERYRPKWLAIRGALCEPYSRTTRKVMHDGSTWALYGFETIFWIRKI